MSQPQPAANTDYVEIKRGGWYQVEFSALFDNLSDRRLIRADVYKLSSKDPAASCTAVTSSCDVLLQLRLTTKLTAAPSSADSNTDLTSSTLTSPPGPPAPDLPD